MTPLSREDTRGRHPAKHLAALSLTVLLIGGSGRWGQTHLNKAQLTGHHTTPYWSHTAPHWSPHCPPLVSMGSQEPAATSGNTMFTMASASDTHTVATEDWTELDVPSQALWQDLLCLLHRDSEEDTGLSCARGGCLASRVASCSCELLTDGRWRAGCSSGEWCWRG